MMDGLLGTWRLATHCIEDGSGARREPFGAQPGGLLVVGSDGYLSVLITADPAAAAETPFLGYAGRYRLEEDRLITAVEVAWVPAWVGSEQVRGVRLDGDRLELTTVPTPMPGTGATVVATLVWARAT